MIMERVPEPELMQNLLQVQAYAEADFSVGDDSLARRIKEYLFLNGKILAQKRHHPRRSPTTAIGGQPIWDGLSRPMVR